MLKNDDKKVKYYTGLSSYALLKVVFDFVCENIPKGVPRGGSRLLKSWAQPDLSSLLM